MSLDSDFATIRALEERAFNAWPALQTVLTNGWIFRWADGYTSRANSANAVVPLGPFTQTLEAGEAFYTRQGLPTIFRLSPLAGQEAEMELASAGYRRIDETIVLIADLASRVPATIYGTTSSSGVYIDIASAPDLAWCDGVAETNCVPTTLRSAHDRMLGALRLPAAFAVLRTGATPLAYGLAVVERGMVGLFDIVTVPDARRRGYGRCLVEALLAWGMMRGASGAYLQVVATNTPALTLYDQLGFYETYRYHYRIR